jgi:hypothetical protein
MKRRRQSRSSDAKERVGPILRALDKAYPRARTALAYRTPFELLIATILSAQSTDETVNRVTPVLFARSPDARALAAARLQPRNFCRHARQSREPWVGMKLRATDRESSRPPLGRLSCSLFITW